MSIGAKMNKLLDYALRMKAHGSSPCYVDTDELLGLLEALELAIKQLESAQLHHMMPKSVIGRDIRKTRAKVAALMGGE